MDIKTILVVLAVSTYMSSMIIFAIHRYRFPVRGTLYFVYGSFMASAGLLLISLRHFLPHSLTIVAANLLVIYGYAMGWTGIRLFLGRSSLLKITATTPLISLPVIVWFTYLHPSYVLRSSLISILLGLYSLGLAWELLFRGGGAALFGQRVMGILNLTNAAVLFIRVIFFYFGEPSQDLFNSGPATAILYLWSFAFIFCYTSLMILMISERLMERIKVLRGIIPICSNCKKIRDDQGYWNLLESYITTHSEAEFTHGICPDCMRELYPEMEEEEESGGSDGIPS